MQLLCSAFKSIKSYFSNLRSLESRVEEISVQNLILERLWAFKDRQVLSMRSGRDIINSPSAVADDVEFAAIAD